MDYNKLFLSLFNRDKPESIEAAIKLIKDAGALQIDSIKVLIAELKISLKEADALILNSVAWIQEWEKTERLREDIENVFDKLKEDEKGTN